MDAGIQNCRQRSDQNAILVQDLLEELEELHQQNNQVSSINNGRKFDEYVDFSKKIILYSESIEMESSS